MKRLRLPPRVVLAVRVVFAAGILLGLYALLIETRWLTERAHTLELRGWPSACEGLRIDVAADLHTGSFGNGTDHLDTVVAKLVASDAGIVLLGGDYVTFKVLFGGYVPGEVIAEHLRPLTAKKRVYAVLGNHDWWEGGEAVARAMRAAGVEMIDHRAVPVTAGECSFQLVGLGDEMEDRSDIATVFAPVPADAAVVALAHEPATFARLPARVALTVSGHTHGGQVNPFSSPWRTSGFRPDSYWLRGQVRDGERLLFVTPGIGTSILPLRLGVRPEISKLTLRREPWRGSER